jgi:hypothetical protein
MKQESKKMMEIIHNNYQKVRIERLAKEDMKELERREYEAYCNKMMKLMVVIGIIGLVLEIIIVSIGG